MATGVMVKIFRIKGYYFKQGKNYFTKEYTAVSVEDAKEKVFCELGSRNRVKRNMVKITSIDEIGIEEVTDKNLKQLLTKDDIRIPVGE